MSSNEKKHSTKNQYRETFEDEIVEVACGRTPAIYTSDQREDRDLFVLDVS